MREIVRDAVITFNKNCRNILLNLIHPNCTSEDLSLLFEIRSEETVFSENRRQEVQLSSNVLLKYFVRFYHQITQNSKCEDYQFTGNEFVQIECSFLISLKLRQCACQRGFIRIVA